MGCGNLLYANFSISDFLQFFLRRSNIYGICSAMLFQSEKAILGVARRVPGYSRSSSRNSKFHSRSTKSHSRNGIPRLEQYEKQNSRSNSRSDSQNWLEPTWKILICPSILGAFFSRIRVVPARQKNICLYSDHVGAHGKGVGVVRAHRPYTSPQPGLPKGTCASYPQRNYPN